MKKLYILIVIFAISACWSKLAAQANLEVLLKNRMNFAIDLQQLDSISFEGSNNNRMVFHYGEQFDTLSIARIDTIRLNGDTIQLDNPMAPEFEEQLRALPNNEMTLREVLFEDGQSVHDFLEQNNPDWLTDPPYLKSVITNFSGLSAKMQRKHLLANMFEAANRLVTDQLNPSNGPGTSGLAYVWGGRNPDKLTKPQFPEYSSSLSRFIPSINALKTACPPDSGCNAKNDRRLYGLDCSGFVSLIAERAGIKFPLSRYDLNAKRLNDTANWNKGLKSPSSYRYTKLRYKPMGTVPAAQLIMGDVIVNNALSHIGIVLADRSGAQTVVMYQSNGQNYRCPKNSNGQLSLGCLDNNTPNRGPRRVTISSGDFSGLFGTNYRVIRLDSISDCPDTLTDIDGNVYQTVSIGTQCWMKTNLKTTRYRDGSAIPTGLSDSQWQNTNSGAYAIYDNNAANNDTYGKLYNWFAVTDSRNLCPTGWHVPSDAEWTTLENFLGGVNVAGGKMKAVSSLWTSPNTGATDESGFSGLPGGCRFYLGSYFGVGNYGYWWSSTESSTTYAWGRGLGYVSGGSNRSYYYEPYGFGVRCLRD